jgi:hypothetical protein
MQTSKRLASMLLFVLLIVSLVLSSTTATAQPLAAVDDNYTVALLHLDGADASTTITDESGKTWTPAGNAQIDTAQSVFGGAALLLDGTGDYVVTSTHSGFQPAAEDFTIDFRVRFSSITNAMVMYSQYTDGNNQIAVWKNSNANGNKLTFTVYSSGSAIASYTMESAWSPSTNTWYHIAVIRSGSNIYISINGSLQTLSVTAAIAAQSLPNLSSNPTVGAYSTGTFPLFGWIDEFRFSKGISRWTTNFTPPTDAYAPAIPSTDTPTSTATSTETQTPTSTATSTETQTPTSTSTATETITPTATNTGTLTLTSTATETLTPTSTITPGGVPTWYVSSEITYGDYGIITGLLVLTGALIIASFVVVTLYIVPQRRGKS